MLSERTVGFIGAGNMAEALIRGMLKSSSIPANRIWASRRTASALVDLETELGVRTTTHNGSLIEACDIVVLCVKPQMLLDLLRGIGALFGPHHTVMSVAAGVTTASIESTLPANVPVIRVMPNTPALVGEGVSGFCRGTHANPSHASTTAELFSTAGIALEIEEEMMNALTAISGSGPAYVFYIMEALFAGATKVGLSTEQANQLVAQTIAGAARLALETGTDPAELRRRVTSPGGTTQAALRSLEASEVAEAVVKAVVAARDRGVELGRQSAPPSDSTTRGGRQ